MEKITKIIMAIIALFVTTELKAQFTGPGSNDKLYTVKEIKANASRLDKTDALVKIKGFIIEKINNDTFWFQDSTDKILVEIGKKHIPVTPFNEKTEVILIGEVDYDLLEGVEIEVEQFLFPNSK